MRCNWRRWLWGVIPLVGAGLAAAQLERAAIEKDLSERTAQALTAIGAHWAVVSIKGRDVVLTGNATFDNEPVEAEAALRGVWGVGNVSNGAALPPKVEPFQWSARRRGNRVRLFGYVPNRGTRLTILGMANAALPGLEVIDRTRVARGVPPTDTWLAGLSFALRQLASLKQGEVRLDDLSLTIAGEAEDPASYRTVSAALKRGLPKGVTLASAQIAVPVVSPYMWSAQFAGGQLVLSGHVTGEGARADLLAAARTAAAAADIVDRMEPAGGAPAGWAEVAAALIKEMVRLQSGSAEMKDAAVVVTGIAADEAQAQAVRDGLRAAVPASFKLTDQIRVREPKVETKPPAEPAPPAGPVEQQAKAEQLSKAEAPPAPPAAVAPPAAEPESKVAAPAPPAPPAVPAVTPPAAAPVPAPEAAPKTAAPAPAQRTDLAVCRDELSKMASANPIVFERGSAKIEGAGLEALDRIAAAIKACPGVRVAAQGHADIEGSPEHNQRLSIKRAQAVADYLIGAGVVGVEQVETAGFGTSRPAVPNITALARAKNRRTEILVRP